MGENDTVPACGSNLKKTVPGSKKPSGYVFRLEFVALILFLFFLFYVFAGSLSFDFPDFRDHSKAAERIARGELLYRDHISYLNVYHYPPVFLYSLGAVYYFLGVNMFAAKVFLAVFNLFAGILLYLIVRDLLAEKEAFFVVFLFLVSPLTFSAVYVGYFDNFVVFFMLLSLYFLFHSRAIPGGVSLAAAFMSKAFPVLLLFVLVPFYLKQGRFKFVFRFVVGFAVGVGVISVPFLVLAPGEFLHYAFFYNFERHIDSLSLYFYFLPGLGTGVILALQAVFLGWLTVQIFKSEPTVSALMQWTLFLFVGFFMLNRINYPHYFIYTVPFFSFVLVESYRFKERVFGFQAWKHLVFAFLLVLVGSWVWSYPWSKGVFDFRSSSYFWLGAATYFLGSLYLLAGLYSSLSRFCSSQKLSEKP